MYTILLGVFLVVVAKAALNPKLITLFKYYIFIMIAVVIFDTVKNFTQHESASWKFAAILSNGIVLASCVIILQQMFKVATAIQLSALPLLSKLILMPNFMLFLGIFLIVENALWIFIYDHF